MPTDYAKLTENLCRFYDFRDKFVLYVGAGGRQLLDPTSGARKIVAIDKDVHALADLNGSLHAKGWTESTQVIAADFVDVRLHGDVVYFEFCLHEMDDPETALKHAKSLAPDVIVYDHSPGSEWIYYGVEEDKVARSAAVMERFGIRRREKFHAEQRFADYAELYAKVAPQGPLAIERIQKFATARDIVLPMEYEVNLL